MTSVQVTARDHVPVPVVARDYISFSAISTFRTCPLKYHFRYHLGMPEERVSSTLVFGGAIHAAVEFHFREMLAGNPPADLDTLLSAYQEAWRERDLNHIQFGKDETVDTLGSLAERMLSAFLDCDFAQAPHQIVGVEEELRGPVVCDCPDLLGRVDLLTVEDDQLVITDLKTSRSRWNQDQAQASAEQLLLYGGLARRVGFNQPIRLRFVIITKTKTPVVEAYDVQFDNDRLDRLKLAIHRVWQAIQTTCVYPAPSPMACPSCGYRDACASWSGN